MTTVNAITIIPEVQIDLECLHDAQVMHNYVMVELGLKAIVTDGSPAILSIFDVPDNKLSTIRRRCAVENFSKGTVKVINTVRDIVVGGADFAAYRVAGPIAQAGIVAGTGIAKVVAKAALATSATLIGSTIENARRTGQELRIDPEVLKAKKELTGAFTSIKNLFGLTSTSNVRVIND